MKTNIIVSCVLTHIQTVNRGKNGSSVISARAGHTKNAVTFLEQEYTFVLIVIQIMNLTYLIGDYNTMVNHIDLGALGNIQKCKSIKKNLTFFRTLRTF